MKVRYKGINKIEYNGRQYHNGDIMDIKDLSEMNMKQFEYISQNKVHIEFGEVHGLITKIETEIEKLNDYLKELKTREKGLLTKLKKTQLKETQTKDKEVE